jgi:diacylglycerol O-acyltransferase
MWLIEGLGDDRWAMLSKVHHCMVDGIAGSDLLAVVMDLEPDAPAITPDVWSPRPEPSRVELACYTARMTVESVSGAVCGGFHAVTHPADALGRVCEVAAGATRMIVPLRLGVRR